MQRHNTQGMVGVTAELTNQTNNDVFEELSRIIDFGKFGVEVSTG
jgi:hypothetical protein